MVLNLIMIFVIKVFDNILMTGKTILVQKNKSVYAAITVIITQIIFYKLIDAVVSADNDLTMWIVAIASGVGTYLVLKINTRFSKEKTYVNVILSDNKEALKEFGDYLISHNIVSLVTDAYTRDWEKTIALTVYAETKEHSKLVSEYIKNSDAKFKRVVYNK